MAKKKIVDPSAAPAKEKEVKEKVFCLNCANDRPIADKKAHIKATGHGLFSDKGPAVEQGGESE